VSPPGAASAASAHPLECLAYILDATYFAGPLAETIADTLERACLASGVGWTHVVGTKRSPMLTRARRAAAVALKAVDRGDGRCLSLEEIGLCLGGKDHTSVLYYLGALKRQAVGGAA
jgi:chromosomal replication initiation ATPase DnaA